MSREFERRAAVLESLRAGRSASEIITFFGYGKSYVYHIRKEYETATNKEEITADRKTHKRRSDCKRNDDFMAEVKATIDEDPSKSMGQLAKEFNVGKATIHRTVHDDLGYRSFVLRRRQLLTEATKERRKLRAQALLNDLKRDSAGLLRFFSDEKKFIQDQKVNRQNDRWLCDDPFKVPTVMHTKCPSSVMVLGVVSSEGHIMPPYFFPQGLRINADVLITSMSSGQLSSHGWIRWHVEGSTSSSRTLRLLTRLGRRRHGVSRTSRTTGPLTFGHPAPRTVILWIIFLERA